jgi:hypothetical protein
MRCEAELRNLDNIAYRATGDTSTRCVKIGHYRYDGQWVCFRHLPAEWRTHYTILRRIRAIPNRAIYSLPDGQ